MDAKSPLQMLSEVMESALAARRAKVEQHLANLEALVLGYRRAVETELARGFAAEHGFKQVPAASPSPARAAENLLHAVQSLPEVANLHSELSSEFASGVDSRPPDASNPSKLEPKAEETALPAAGFPLLARAVIDKKLVVIGGISKRDRSSALPNVLAERCEWIDTEHDGAHAVGNLPQRVRQGRVAAIVILHRAVQHKHTEAVLAAARDAGVPFAFAGQGGKSSLLRAVEQLEITLSR